MFAPHDNFFVPDNAVAEMPESEMQNIEDVFESTIEGPNVLPILNQKPRHNYDGVSSPSGYLGLDIKGPNSTGDTKRALEEPSNHQNNDNNPEEMEEDQAPKRKRRKRCKKPTDLPLRPLSAYNIFFSEQRKLILAEIDRKEQQGEVSGNVDVTRLDFTPRPVSIAPGDIIPCVLKARQQHRVKRAHRRVHGKISMVVMAREVSKRWKSLSADQRMYYKRLAEQDKLRHEIAMKNYMDRKAVEAILKSTKTDSRYTRVAPQQQLYEPLPCVPTFPGLKSEGHDNSGFRTGMMDSKNSYGVQSVQVLHPLQTQPIGMEKTEFSSASSSSLYQDNFLLAHQHEHKRRQAFSNMIGGPRIDFGGPMYGQTSTFTTPSSTSQPSNSTVGVCHNKIISLTPSEHMMIMEGRAAAAKAAQQAVASSVGNLDLSTMQFISQERLPMAPCENQYLESNRTTSPRATHVS